MLAPLRRLAVGVPVAKAAGFHPAAEAVQVETQRRMEVSGLMANVEATVATQKLRLLASRAEQLHIDGEAVLLGVDGRSDFNGLHSRK